MDRCLWKGKPVSAYDAKNIYGEWDFALKAALVEAGQNRELTCDDCGEHVYYRPGQVKEPHFAHFKNDTRLCALADERESEEHRQGKRVLYHYFRERYPNAVIRLSVTHSFRRRSDLFIQFEDGKRLAVEYQCQDMHVTDWKDKQADYSLNGIKALWILSARAYAGTDIAKRFFAELIAHGEQDGILVMLDPALLTFGLSKTVCYKDDEGRTVESHIVERFYPFADLNVLPDGRVYHVDFEQAVSAAERELTSRAEASIQEAKDLQLRYMAWAEQNSISTTECRLVSSQSVRLDKQCEQSHPKIDDDSSQRVVEGSQVTRLLATQIASLETKQAICRQCGVLTSDYVIYYGVNNTCLCRDCLRN